MILPVVLLFAAYGGISYAGILLKGWNVTISQWFNPLAGFTWAKDPLCIPDTQVFPGGAGTQCGGKANSPGSSCGSFSESELLKIMIDPFAQAKLEECLAGKGADELKHIAKDLWGWLFGGHGTRAAPPPTGAVPCGPGRPCPAGETCIQGACVGRR